jgi:hypothetical protein
VSFASIGSIGGAIGNSPFFDADAVAIDQAYDTQGAS